MNEQHLGSCLCGAIRFKLEGQLERFFLCHCAYCRKDTGSAHAANLFFSIANLEWLSGQERLSTYKLPKTRHARCFCSTCGSAMPHVAEQWIAVPAGCLDTELAAKPNAHLFIASKARWDHDLDTVPTFDGFPS